MATGFKTKKMSIIGATVSMCRPECLVVNGEGEEKGMVWSF
jgi:hypothetical protein